MDPSRLLREALSFVAVLGGTSMSVATVGLDIAKQFFQIHGVDANGRAVLRVLTKIVQLQPVLKSLASIT
jgi:hypothetical protein